MYNLGLLKLYYKINIRTIPLYFHNFLITEIIPVPTLALRRSLLWHRDGNLFEFIILMFLLYHISKIIKKFYAIEKIIIIIIIIIITIILYFRHLSIYTIKHNYKKYIHTIKNKYITGKNNY